MLIRILLHLVVKSLYIDHYSMLKPDHLYLAMNYISFICNLLRVINTPDDKNIHFNLRNTILRIETNKAGWGFMTPTDMARKTTLKQSTGDALMDSIYIGNSAGNAKENVYKTKSSDKQWKLFILSSVKNSRERK